MTYAIETGAVAAVDPGVTASVPNTTPVVASVKTAVPVGAAPLFAPVMEREKVTFCPGSTMVLVVINATAAGPGTMVTCSPLDLLGAKVASPAYLANN